MNLAPLCRACHHDAHRTERANERIQQMKDDFAELVDV
jgi:predicted HNH restriction endonuclease